MVLFLHGLDSFRLHERLEALRVGFVHKYDPAGTGIVQVDAASLTAERLPSLLLSNGLFSTKRYVVIREVFALPDIVTPVLLDVLTKVDADSIVVFTASEVPKVDSDLKTALSQIKHVETFPLLEASQLTSWLKQRVQMAEVSIDPAAVHYLVHAIGSDLWKLNGVVQQLAHYTKTIQLADAELFVTSPLDDNIFHLTDALSERQPEQALRLLHDQLSAGASPFYILTMLARQCAILLQVKAGGSAMAALHPYVQKRAGQHAQRFSEEQLTRLYQTIAQTDYKLKTTNLEPIVLLDQLVATVTI